jgi:hypothetical protein
VVAGTESRRWWECGAEPLDEWPREGNPNKLDCLSRRDGYRPLSSVAYVGTLKWAQFASSWVAPQELTLLSLSILFAERRSIFIYIYSMPSAAA